MAFDRPPVYLTIGGILGNPRFEIWQTGLHIAAPNSGVATLMPNDAQLTSLYTTIETLWGGSGCQIGNSCALGWIKAAPLDENGDYRGDALIHEAITYKYGTQTTNPHPWQVAFVMSLISGSQLGKANYGRNYLPDPRYNVGADGKIAGTQQSFVNWWASVLAAINTSAATWGTGVPGTKIAIMSKTGVTKFPNRVQGGNVLDTQRRRRNALVETYLGGVGYP
jgi:hypothetical protein